MANLVVIVGLGPFWNRRSEHHQWSKVDRFVSLGIVATRRTNAGTSVLAADLGREIVGLSHPSARLLSLPPVVFSSYAHSTSHGISMLSEASPITHSTRSRMASLLLFGS